MLPSILVLPACGKKYFQSWFGSNKGVSFHKILNQTPAGANFSSETEDASCGCALYSGKGLISTTFSWECNQCCLLERVHVVWHEMSAWNSLPRETKITRRRPPKCNLWSSEKKYGINLPSTSTRTNEVKIKIQNLGSIWWKSLRDNPWVGVGS